MIAQAAGLWDDLRMDQSQRLDKWLWCARFHKTRALAVEAIQGGHVHVNGQRVKPSKAVRPGDRLRITRGGDTWEITITALADRRGPASEARTLYIEDETSRARREALREQRRLAAPRPEKRPDKRQRRRIVRFRNIHDR